MLSDKLKQVALKSKKLYQEKYPAALEGTYSDKIAVLLPVLPPSKQAAKQNDWAYLRFSLEPNVGINT